MNATHLSELTWPELEQLANERGPLLLVVPLGSCEQHGPHLPVDTDLRIASALAGELAHRRTDVVIAPAVTIGASGEHQSFPGTLSIGTLALETTIVELCRSALPPPGSTHPRPFDAVLFVNGHGGNIDAVGRALSLLVDEGRDVTVWHPQVPGGDSHAGRTETSMLFHLDPDCVRLDRVEPGSTARWREIGATVMAEGLAAVTPNGVLGDPTGSSATEGAEIVAALVEHLCDAVASHRGSAHA